MFEIRPLEVDLLVQADHLSEKKNQGSLLIPQYYEDSVFIDQAPLNTATKRFLIQEVNRVYTQILKEMGNATDPKFLKLMRIKKYDSPVIVELRRYLKELLKRAGKEEE